MPPASADNNLQIPHYHSAVWGGIDTGLTNELQKLQNRAAHIIVGAIKLRCKILSDSFRPKLDEPDRQMYQTNGTPSKQ